MIYYESKTFVFVIVFLVQNLEVFTIWFGLVQFGSARFGSNAMSSFSFCRFFCILLSEIENLEVERTKKK